MRPVYIKTRIAVRPLAVSQSNVRQTDQWLRERKFRNLNERKDQTP